MYTFNMMPPKKLMNKSNQEGNQTFIRYIYFLPKCNDFEILLNK